MHHRQTDKTKLTLLFANVQEQDILLKGQLDLYAKESQNEQFKVVYILNQPPTEWTGEVGFITPEIIQKYLHLDTSESTSQSEHKELTCDKILLCGPPPMMTSMISHLKGPSQLTMPSDYIYKF